MGWEQLDAIRAVNAANQEAEQQRLEDPIHCPRCRTRLHSSPDGDRNCPYGHYRWEG